MLEFLAMRNRWNAFWIRIFTRLETWANDDYYKIEQPCGCIVRYRYGSKAEMENEGPVSAEICAAHSTLAEHVSESPAS